MQFPKVLVFGSNGQIATALRSCLKSGIFLNRNVADFRKPGTLNEILNKQMPDLVIITSAYTAVDLAEVNQTDVNLINVVSPSIIATWCANHDRHLIHFSTDYVFSGNGDQPWIETDPTGPINIYGSSKHESEVAVLKNKKTLVLRTSWVYSPWGSNFLKSIIKAAHEKETLDVVVDQIGTPTSAMNIAIYIESMISNLKSLTEQQFGIYHLTDVGYLSWHDFAVFIIEELNNRELPILTKNVMPVASSRFPRPAKRPLNSRLNCDRFDQTFKIKRLDWKQSALKTIEQVVL